MMRRQNMKNAKLDPEGIARFCIQEDASKGILNAAINRYGFSPRLTASCIKTARTIADLAGSEKIRPAHMRESVEYHKLCCNMIPEL